MADLCGWKIRFKVILIDWESFDDILMHFNDQIREKTWWVNARKMLIRKDSTENQSVCMQGPFFGIVGATFGDF